MPKLRESKKSKLFLQLHKECKKKRKLWKFGPIGDSKFQTKTKHHQPSRSHFKLREIHKIKVLSKSELKNNPPSRGSSPKTKRAREQQEDRKKMWRRVKNSHKPKTSHEKFYNIQTQPTQHHKSEIDNLRNKVTNLGTNLQNNSLNRNFLEEELRSTKAQLHAEICARDAEFQREKKRGELTASVIAKFV